MNYSQFSQYAIGIRIYESELNPKQFLKHAGQDTGSFNMNEKKADSQTTYWTFLNTVLASWVQKCDLSLQLLLLLLLEYLLWHSSSYKLFTAWKFFYLMGVRKSFDGDEDAENGKMSGNCKWRFLFAEPEDILRTFCNNMKWVWMKWSKWYD